jgi:peptide deformylase
MSSMAVEAFTPRVTGRSDSPAMVHCRQKSRRTFTNTLQNNHQQQDNHHHHLSRILFSSRLFSAPFKEEVDPGVVEGLRIVKYPHPALRAENEEVTPKELKETKEIADLSRRMLKLMYNAEGVGLAAPQVGVNKRLMVYNPSGDSKRWLDETVLVNPRIVEYSDAQDEEIEGCLSFPDMSGEVVRSKWIKVEAMNLSGKKIKKKFSGWEARIFQHEYDHLDGTVYIDRLSEATRAKVQPRLDELIKEFGNDGAL